VQKATLVSQGYGISDIVRALALKARANEVDQVVDQVVDRTTSNARAISSFLDEVVDTEGTESMNYQYT
jgi:alpha-D-ribose 1-methylphosphonate 5-phosphate C-P lyase